MVIALLAVLLGEPLTAEAPLMGTVFRVTLLAHDDAAARDAIRACFRHWEHVDQVMSEWKPDSPLSRLNKRAGEGPVPLPDDLLGLLQTSLWVAEQSDGAFEPTWAALWGLWKFKGEPSVPSDARIEERRALVNWRELKLDRTAGTAELRHKGMAVGLGAIGKGYALDLAQRDLRARGYSNFLLYAGGQIYAAGQKPEGPWMAGVQDPRGSPEDVLASLEVRDASVSTSGDYESYFVKDGKLYHHILDPRTGKPARRVRSATVVAANATLADGFSTASFVLGPEKALALARELGFELLIVDERGALHWTPALKARTRLLHPPAAAELPKQ